MRPMILGIVASLALTAAPASAQIAFTVEPDLLYAGDPVTLTLTESRGGTVTFSHGCYVDEVRAGHRDGPLVWTAVNCPDIVVTLDPHTSLTHTWEPRDLNGAELIPGTYALRVTFSADADPFELEQRWVSVTWLPEPSAPSLFIRSGRPRVGQPVLLALRAPAYADCFYVAAASLGTQSGFDIIPGYLRASLDQDALFGLSFPEPHPALFLNFQGTLDGSGWAPEIGILVPDFVPLTYTGLAVQAVVFPLEQSRILPPAVTNPVSFTLWPRRDG